MVGKKPTVKAIPMRGFSRGYGGHSGLRFPRVDGMSYELADAQVADRRYGSLTLGYLTGAAILAATRRPFYQRQTSFRLSK